MVDTIIILMFKVFIIILLMLIIIMSAAMTCYIASRMISFIISKIKGEDGEL